METAVSIVTFLRGAVNSQLHVYICLYVYFLEHVILLLHVIFCFPVQDAVSTVTESGRSRAAKWQAKQVFGKQLPGQQNQGVPEVVAMENWMLTKACEAEKTNCPHHYLQACQSYIFAYLPLREREH